MTSDTGAFGRPRFGLRAVLARSRYAAAALDQMALSVFGFALNIVLLRVLSEADYGVVSLWMTMSLFAVSVQAALVNGPLNIYLPGTREPEAARRLESTLATMNLLTVLAAAALAGVTNVVTDAEWAARGAPTAAAVSLFVAAGMYREYHRSTAFSRHDMAMLFWVDAPYLAVTGTCLAVMALCPQRFTSLTTAFFAMSVGCLVSQVCVRLRGGASLPLFRRGWLETYRGIGKEVAWSLAGVVANHAENRSYVYIATGLAGMTSLAAINAVGLLFRPVSVLVSAWGQSILPHLAAALSNGRIAEFDRALGRALVATAVGSIVVGFALWFAWKPIERHVLAGKYPEGIRLLWPWAAASGASVLRYVGSTGLMAARDFKFLAKAQTVCGLLAAAATAGFILWHGYTAAMWGIALGNGLCFAWAMLRLRRVRRRPPASAAATP
jgi:O-antigen/teichoic acid export membrane protein